MHMLVCRHRVPGNCFQNQDTSSRNAVVLPLYNSGKQNLKRTNKHILARLMLSRTLVVPVPSLQKGRGRR